MDEVRRTGSKLPTHQIFSHLFFTPKSKLKMKIPGAQDLYFVCDTKYL